MEHVVVVGAGIGGLAASLALSCVARRVTLIERAEHPAEVAAALALQANGLAVLSGLGLLSAVEHHGSRMDRVEIRNVAGDLLLGSSMPDLGDGLDHALAVRRTQLHATLLDAVRDTTTVQTRFGCTVVSADSSGSLVVRASPSDSGTTTTISADLVVGADGVGSAVRSTGRFSSKVSAGTTYVRAVVRGGGNPWLEEFWTPAGSFGHAPLGDNAVYVWAAAQSATVAEALARRDLACFVDHWREVLPLAGDLLAKIDTFDELLVNTARRVDCRRWFSGRLVLLGDAAHAMAPNLGQGANSALVDAVALAEALASTNAIEPALKRYDHRRRPVVRRIQNTAGALDRLANLRSAPAIRARDAVLRSLARVPRLSDATTRHALTGEVLAVRTARIFDHSDPAADR